MNTRHTSGWFWPALAVACLAVTFLANKAATQPQGGTARAEVKTAGGLTVVTFITNPGKIRVNLPDDMRAGDTISGTVIAEPNGATKEERGANQAELNKFGIKLFTSSESQAQEVGIGDVSTVFKYSLINDRDSGTVLSAGLQQRATQVPGTPQVIVWATIHFLPRTSSGAVVTPDPKITQPTHPSATVITPDPKTDPTKQPGKLPTLDDLKIDPKDAPSPAMVESPLLDNRKITTDPTTTAPTKPPGPTITPADPKLTPTFIIPQLGQTGWPLLITGPFDGDSHNSILQYSIIEFGGRADVIRGGPSDFIVIAESPRKAVFQVPTNVTGPVELNLKEGNVQTRGTYRNVDVKLSAPKTELLKGEKTTLTVQVTGLQGLKTPVPLTLESKGVITMEGGFYQPLVIQPSQVGADGRYTTTRGITGVQTGGWEATATVVTTRFNVCLQDETASHRRILWNTINGDYAFTYPEWWPPDKQSGGGSTGESVGGKTGGTTGLGGTAPADPNQPPTSPPTSLTGIGKMNMKGCIITLQHNAPDRRVFARLDACTKSGSSEVEAPKTDFKFTITDRNMADNACQSQ